MCPRTAGSSPSGVTAAPLPWSLSPSRAEVGSFLATTSADPRAWGPSVATGLLPGAVSTFEVHDRTEARPLEERGGRGRAHTGRAVDEERAPGREARGTSGQVPERHGH